MGYYSGPYWDGEEPPEGDEDWEDDVPEWWWETSYVDAADYDWNEARYIEWLESVAAAS